MLRFLPKDQASAIIVLLISIVAGLIAFAPPSAVVPHDPSVTDAATTKGGRTARTPISKTPRAESPADYSETLLRPLFEPDRVAHESADDATSSETQTTDSMSMLAGNDTSNEEPDLIGIALEGSKETAIFRARNKATVEHAAVGDEVSGWTVREVRSDQVTISRQGNDRTLTLKRRGGPPGRTTIDLVEAANSSQKLLIEQIRAATNIANLNGDSNLNERSVTPAIPNESSPDDHQ